MRVQDWLGKDNKIGLDIWKNKYQYNTESFDQWVERVSGGDGELAELICQKKLPMPEKTILRKTSFRLLKN